MHLLIPTQLLLAVGLRAVAPRAALGKPQRGSEVEGTVSSRQCVMHEAGLAHSVCGAHRLCASGQAVISLMEMGFDEKEVIDALRVNNNQQNAAVSTWGPAYAPLCVT